ncbi:MAG: AAA family ATPase [Planctomycetota bacterium]|nr:AAA family ATPase [Planctomycetota bacterium]
MDPQELETGSHEYVRQKRPDSPPPISDGLTELLVRHRVLHENRAESVALFASRQGVSIVDALVQLAVCTEEQLAGALSHILKVPQIDPADCSADLETLMRVPKSYLIENACLPYRDGEGTLTLLMSDPTLKQLFKDIVTITGERLNVVVGMRTSILKAIDEAYAHATSQMDEAELLQQELLNEMKDMKRSGSQSRSFGVLSNKGGVGKTHTSINLAYTFAEMGFRVLVIDADTGNADVSNKLRLFPIHTLADFLDKKVDIKSTLLETQFGFFVVPGKSGEMRLANMKYSQRLRFMKAFAQVGYTFDIVIYDLGAGLSLQVLDFAHCVDDVIIVTTPRDLVSGYSCAKLVFYRYIELESRLYRSDPEYQVHSNFEPWLLFNQVEKAGGCSEFYRSMVGAAKLCQYEELNTDLAGFELSPLLLGEVMRDSDNYIEAEHLHQPFSKTFPFHPNVQQYRTIARALLNKSLADPQDGRNLNRQVRLVTNS